MIIHRATINMGTRSPAQAIAKIQVLIANGMLVPSDYNKFKLVWDSGYESEYNSIEAIMHAYRTSFMNGYPSL